MTERPMSKDDRADIRCVINEHRDAELQQLELNDPEWGKRVAERKRKVAIGRLKIEKDLVERDALLTQIATLKEKLEAVDAKIKKKMPLGKPGRYDGCPKPLELCEAISLISDEVHLAETKKDAAGSRYLAIMDRHRVMMEQLAMCSTREQFAALVLIKSK